MNTSNNFKQKLEEGDVVVGAKCSTFSENTIEVYSELELDYVWLDLEHFGPSPWDSHVFERLTRAAELSDIELLVRIPYINQSLIRKTLDAGVRNLLIPRLDTAEQVRDVVEAGRFVYDGEPGQRGTSSGRANEFGGASEYIESEDEDVCIGVMIEKEEAVDNIDEILDVPELGFVFVGSGDLSVQLGHPGERSHEDVKEAVSHVLERSKVKGIPAGRLISDADDGHVAKEDGFSILRLGDEYKAVRKQLGGEAESLASYL